MEPTSASIATGLIVAPDPTQVTTVIGVVLLTALVVKKRVKAKGLGFEFFAES
ncbi:hypothetical protein H6G76_31010 [Nostoc sp. FACHB-152]|uniref:hypothetical protein n=1 Tax=unclassified Nostoc TaxID=2593658 RepID=UPI00168520FE|nr:MULTISPECIES: hypothetical protein [unclassified Nostoc]MBD2451476.1 hypothetical protein [Nostoc sp. FACHB-152]MBD2472517.1 hypothetical protein [Nostoc sp. FACHB-145]